LRFFSNSFHAPGLEKERLSIHMKNPDDQKKHSEPPRWLEGKGHMTSNSLTWMAFSQRLQKECVRPEILDETTKQYLNARLIAKYNAVTVSSCGAVSRVPATRGAGVRSHSIGPDEEMASHFRRDAPQSNDAHRRVAVLVLISSP
jgi:hypothetical protein